MKKGNLLKLADYLEFNVTQEMFNMQNYRSNKDGDSIHFKSAADCGTVGCALGYGPLVEGLEAIDMEFFKNYYNGVYLDFYDYCKRVFGISNFDKKWGFLFEADWYSHDNTPKGAAARIRYLVDGNSLRSFDSNDLWDAAHLGEVKASEAIEELILNYNLHSVLRDRLID